MNPALNQTLDYLRELADCRFWGYVGVKFENGQIVHVRQEENLKPSELPGRNRSHAHERNQ
jgi:hypothetical protein